MIASQKPAIGLAFTLLCCAGLSTITESAGADPNDKNSSEQLQITNTIDAKTVFRIFRRRQDSHHWDAGRAYPQTNGVAIIKALDGAKLWDGKRHAAAYGLLHAHTPSVEITIDWSRTKSEKQTRSITLCYGNRLFWYGASVYQVPERSYLFVDGLFPRNK